MSEYPLGTMFGCDLVLKTDNPALGRMAEKWLDRLSARDKELMRRETAEELKTFSAP